MRLRQRAFFATVSVVWISLWSSSYAAVVFDSLTNAVFADGGYVLGPGNAVGDIITLAGSARRVVEFDIALKEFGDDGEFEFLIRFYAPDGPGGMPGSELWSSPLTHITLPPRQPQVINFSVPRVVVPNRFAWAFRVVDAVHAPGLPREYYNADIVGTPTGPLIEYPPGSWYLDGPWGPRPEPFAVRVVAVPEPAGLLVVTCPLIALFVLRRGRRAALRACSTLSAAVSVDLGCAVVYAAEVTTTSRMP
jgi:hypothetical protein